MQPHADRISPIDVSREWNNQRTERVSNAELHAYCGLAGALMYMGSGVLPQAAYVTSEMQQGIPRTCLQDLVGGNEMLEEFKTSDP